MLDIDTAIKHCLEVAEKNETQADKWQEEGGEEWGKTTACRECAADHRQLAEWLTELKEAKRLLKSATNVLNMFKPCDNDYNCNECINQRQNCDYDDRFKWRYADEALKLIEEDGEYDEKTI
jgi:hypothetical protein